MRRNINPEARRPFAFDILNAAILLVIVWGAFSLSAASTSSVTDFEFNDPILADTGEELMLAYRPELLADDTLPATGSLE